jgi:outer membrane biosynthesis protein TonB/uncharacterized coiled-coil protein SlyX
MSSEPPTLGKGILGYRKSAVNQILADRDIMLRQAEGRVRAAESKVAELEHELSSMRDRNSRSEEQLDRLRLQLDALAARMDLGSEPLPIPPPAEEAGAMDEGTPLPDQDIDAGDSEGFSAVQSGARPDEPYGPGEPEGEADDAESYAMSYTTEGYTFGDEEEELETEPDGPSPAYDELAPQPGVAEGHEGGSQYNAFAEPEPAQSEANDDESLWSSGARSGTTYYHPPSFEGGPEYGPVHDEVGVDEPSNEPAPSSWEVEAPPPAEFPSQPEAEMMDQPQERSMSEAGTDWEPAPSPPEPTTPPAPQAAPAPAPAAEPAPAPAPSPAADAASRLVTSELTAILAAAEESAARIIDRARTTSQRQIAQSNRLWREVQSEIARFASWREEVEPVIHTVQGKVEQIRVMIEEVPERIREALAPMAESISSIDADLAELATASTPPLLLTPGGVGEEASSLDLGDWGDDADAGTSADGDDQADHGDYGTESPGAYAG